MLRLALSALVVGYLPGALLLRIPEFDRSFRAKFDAEERAFWALVLSLTWSIGTVLALGLTGWYSFNRLLLINVCGAGVIVVSWRGQLRYGSEARRVSWPALLPAALIAVAAWLYFPTAEYVMGGKDPGVYVNEGVQIAQRGGLVVRDPVVASVPPALRNLFFPQHVGQQYYGIRFMGFFIQDPSDGRVVGQFMHLFPATVAIGYGLNGLTGARQAVGACAIFGVLAVYFLGVRLFGRAAAFAGAFLLAINVVTVWWARYPNSELIMQALLFSAILAFTHALDGSRRFFGAVAGTLLGLMVFLRYEVVLAFATFGAAAVLAPVVRAKVGVAFFVTLAVTGLAGFFYFIGPMRAYAVYPLDFTRDHGGAWIASGGLVASLLVRRALRADVITTFVRRAVPACLAVVLAALAIYAYVYRQPSDLSAEHDAMAFRTFGWYLTPWVLAVAVLSVTVVTATQFWRSPAFFLTFSAFAVFFFYKIRIVPDHFWATRRFLVMALPGTLLLTGAFAASLVTGPVVPRLMARLTPGHPRSSRGVMAAAAALLIGSIAATFWFHAAPVRSHIEYAGLIPRLERLAARIGDQDLLIVESRASGSDLHTLALPLAYVYARNVLVLNSVTPNRRRFEDFVAWAATRYTNTFFLGGAGTDLLSKRVLAEPVSSDRFQVPEYANTRNAYPTGQRRKEFEFGLYRLVAGAGSTAGPITLRIGVLDDLNVVRFYAREQRADTGMVFRWTRAQSFVLLLGIAPDARQVTVWMSNGGRPKQASPAAVEIALHDRVLGNATPVDEVRPYTFDIPPGIAAQAAASDDPVQLRIRVPTWNPAALLGGNDTRDIGVILTRVEVR